MQDLIGNFREAAMAWGPTLVSALVVLVIGWWLARLFTSLTRRAMTRANVDATLTSFASNLLYMALLVLVGISVLGQLGINTTSFAAVLAAAGLAIGFALQGSLSNFAAGVMLMFFRPFRAGDYVDVGGVSGTIEEVRVFATKIRTPDNKEITVPNGKITGDSIVNYSAKDTRRVDLVFGIAYGDDIATAKKILHQVASADARVLSDPAPTIAVLELADSSVNLALRPWVKSDDYWPVRFDLLERIKVEFDRQGISIPFPQTDVHLHEVRAA